MCTLSFHRHFNYNKSATRTRDIVTIISLTRASYWSLWQPILASDWLLSHHLWLRDHWHRDRSHPVTELRLTGVWVNIVTFIPLPPSPAETLGLTSNSVDPGGWHHDDIITEQLMTDCAIRIMVIREMHRQMGFLTNFWLHFTLRRLQNIDTAGLASSGGCYQCDLKGWQPFLVLWMNIFCKLSINSHS